MLPLQKAGMSMGLTIRVAAVGTVAFIVLDGARSDC